jgi:rubrerythrin
MSEQDLTLVDAIHLAMEAEKKAVTLYKDAAQKAGNLAIERLFSHLVDFEQHHYDKLAELAESLEKKKKFVVYEGYSTPIPAQSEVKISGRAAEVLEAKKVSLMDILTMAQNVEKSASDKYTALAEQTSDKDGKAMFQQLAKEEQHHLHQLTEVYWNLNDRGVWAWPGG